LFITPGGKVLTREGNYMETEVGLLEMPEQHNAICLKMSILADWLNWRLSMFNA
jgi:hypothetical protein